MKAVFFPDSTGGDSRDDPGILQSYRFSCRALVSIPYHVGADA
jgi:hypothetical protein